MNPEEIAKPPLIKLLVVDDREDNLFSIETILDGEAYHIVKATSGRAALKTLLFQQDFALILMDVQMPEMSGLETAELIYQRDKLKHIPIIFITAHSGDERHMFEGYQMGGVDFIYKPINPELLRYKVAVFVDLYRKTQQLLQQEQWLKRMNANLEKEIEDRRQSEIRVSALNEQLIQNNLELKATNEELDRFAYVASHDLQEPLRKIMLFSDSLNRKLQQHPDSRVHDDLDKISKASGRMQKLINDLLHFSRHNNEDSVLSDKVDLNVIVQDVLAEVEETATAKEARIEVDQLPVVQGVSSHLYQLFQNLISNALKFSRAGEVPRIKITATTTAPTPVLQQRYPEVEHYHQISVTDNGIGFDGRHAEDIFVVFKRLHSYHEVEGTGIGLSICRKIVERHGGTIQATGQLGQGATFTIWLPAALPALPAKEEQPVATLTEAAQSV